MLAAVADSVDNGQGGDEECRWDQAENGDPTEVATSTSCAYHMIDTMYLHSNLLYPSFIVRLLPL